MTVRRLTPLQARTWQLRQAGHSLRECARLMGRTMEEIRQWDQKARWKIYHGAPVPEEKQYMLNSISLITDTVRHTLMTAGFTPGERSMLLDIFNATALDPVSIQHGAGLALQVEDSFNLYPGQYEEKWHVERAPLLTKIAELSDWQAACLTIWAVDFWHSGCYEEEDAINRYIQVKLTSGTRLAAALADLSRAIELMEKTKGAFKSPAIAEARSRAESAAKIITTILD